MKEWMNEKAELTVDAGRGWMSRYEFEGCAAGTVIRSRAEAGTFCTARVNGEFFAQVSVKVVEGEGGGGLAAFVESLDEGENAYPESERGDGATELLPFAIRINAVTVPLSALDGTGVFSLINLDRKVDAECDADLIVAGVKAAEGKVSVIGENMGLRLTRLLCAPPQGNFPRTTGSVLAPGYRAEPVKDYNFRMPDCFTKRAILRAGDIHLDFLRGYQSRLPLSPAWKLECVDQLNYTEWLEDLAKPSDVYISFRPAERMREYRRERIVSLPKTFLVEGAGARFPIAGKALDGMRAWAQNRVEKGEGLPFQISLDRAASAMLEQDPAFDIGLACLRNGWLRAADLRVGRGAGAEGASVSAAPFACEDKDRWSMILIARFKAEGGLMMDIIYPEALLEPCLPALGR